MRSASAIASASSVGGGDEAVEEAPGGGFVGGHHAAGVEELGGAALADDAGEDGAGAHVAAGEADAGEEEGGLRLGGAEAEVGGHGDDGAGADADAVDGGDDRLGAGEHRLDEVAGHAGEGEEALHVAADERADDVVHVAAGGEVAAVRAEDDDVDVVGVGEGAEPVAQLGIALEGERVLALGAVEGDAGDAVRRSRRRKCSAHALGLPVGEAVADRLQLLDQVVGLGGGDDAEELVRPRPRARAARPAKSAVALRGQPHQHGAAVALDGQADGEALGFEPVDDAGDVAVGDAEHAESSLIFRPSGARWSAAITSKRGSVVSSGAQPLAQLALDGAARRARRRSQRRRRRLGGGGLGVRSESSRAHASPPETEIAWPVTEAAASEQSQRTAAATSSGSMKRPWGLAARSGASASARRAAGLRHDRLDRALQHRRQHVAGADGVDGDAGLRGLERERAGQADDAVLGGAVAGDVGVALEAGGRGDGDEPAPAGVEHRREGGLPGREDAAEVELDHGGEVLGAGLQERAARGAAGVGDDDLRARPTRRRRRRTWRGPRPASSRRR